MSKTAKIAVLLTALFPYRMTAHAAEDWSEFHRGGNTSMENDRLPLLWSPDDGIAWTVRLPGYGQSSPVFRDGRLFLTAVEGDNKQTNILLAFDANSGRTLWSRRFAAAVKVRNSYMVSRAAPTPLVDEAGVYALFESGDLRAFTHDGAL